MPLIPNTRRAPLSEVLAGREAVALVTPETLRQALDEFAGTREVTSMDFATKTAADLRGKSCRIDTKRGKALIYFDYTGGSAADDPAPGGRGVKVDLGSADYSPTAFTAAIVAALAGDSGLETLNSYDGNVEIRSKQTGARSNIAAGTSGLTVAVVTQGAGDERFTLTFAANPSGAYVQIITGGSNPRLINIAFDNDGAWGNVSPGGGDAEYYVNLPDGVDPNVMANWATYTETALNADSQVDVISRAGAVLTLLSPGATDQIDATGGDVVFNVLSEGQDIAVKEVSTVTLPSAMDVATLKGKYFTLEDHAGAVYIWFTYSRPAGNGIPIAVLSANAGVGPAADCAAALNASGLFSCEVFGKLVMVTDAKAGVRDGSSGGDTGMTITRQIAGTGRTAATLAVADVEEAEILGVVSVAAEHPIYSAVDTVTPAYTRNAGFWHTEKMTHVPAYCSRYGAQGLGCLISPLHVMTANHVKPQVGDTFHFVSDASAVATRTVSAVSQVGAYDQAVALLNTPLPAGYKFARLLPPGWESFLPLLADGERLPVYICSPERKMIVVEPGEIQGQNIVFRQPIEALRAALYTPNPVVAGFSGSAACLMLGAVPVLLTTLEGTGNPSVGKAAGAGVLISGAFLAALISTVNAQGGTRGLQYADLSAFATP